MTPDTHFKEGLAAGEIRLQRCAACDTHIFFPRVLCPACHGTDLTWVTASGAGEVYTFTTVRQRPERGGDYNVAMVELAEGVRMMTRVDGDPQAVKVGMPVTAYVGDIDGTPAVLCRKSEA
ncbi:Zn-ribbon domain-containing OB-fold protein [Loktanella sp. M215]|uniref:Zn-ribbon domain-containing OB-fold protein n=1 Tax=Loktanella sp. M215 TaxID=2675431 RepID=UPI001F31ABED|nr:OB-fold domain-containing protein [Loktanella sp. M215]MCF7697867.1 DNA-binding protein [Loktanella sp. M215]